MTAIVEFFGGPAAGKSTDAAELFVHLKKAGVKTELVREVAKTWAWQGRVLKSIDELYLLGVQSGLEVDLLDKVDVIVTDKPILMDAYYASKYATGVMADAILRSARAHYTELAAMGHKHFAVFSDRTGKIWRQEGRFGSLRSAIEDDEALKRLLRQENRVLWTVTEIRERFLCT